MAGETGGATEGVRDASLKLLTAIQRNDEVAKARDAALRSVDRLEAALPEAAGTVAGTISGRPNVTSARPGVLARLGFRSLARTS